jgi:rhodanese-related sulfurtransferase
VRYGYIPVASLPSEGTIAFVTRNGSPIRTLEDLRGKKLGLPSVESLASYVALGELNTRKLLAKDAHVSVVHYRFHDVALYALSNGFVDAIAVDGELAKAAARDSGMVVYFESPPLRRFGIAVNAQLPVETQVRLRDALLTQKSAAALRNEAASLTGFKSLAATELSYVNKLTYLTPTFLPGATVVGADKVAELIKAGVTCFDVRTEAEYKARHIAGAKFLPYAEHSKKEVGFDRTLDKFALSETFTDKNAPLVFACNGEECWKSYKAATWAIADGYKTVYWFRGGLPEWRSRRFQID